VPEPVLQAPSAIEIPSWGFNAHKWRKHLVGEPRAGKRGVGAESRTPVTPLALLTTT
jgi:hypothetical protein